MRGGNGILKSFCFQNNEMCVAHLTEEMDYISSFGRSLSK